MGRRKQRDGTWCNSRCPRRRPSAGWGVDQDGQDAVLQDEGARRMRQAPRGGASPQAPARGKGPDRLPDDGRGARDARPGRHAQRQEGSICTVGGQGNDGRSGRRTGAWNRGGGRSVRLARGGCHERAEASGLGGWPGRGAWGIMRQAVRPPQGVGRVAQHIRIRVPHGRWRGAGPVDDGRDSVRNPGKFKGSAVDQNRHAPARVWSCPAQEGGRLQGCGILSRSAHGRRADRIVVQRLCRRVF